MRKNKQLIIRTIKLLSIIALYYIIGSKSIFPYVLSLSLYNIFTACFEHITIKPTLDKLYTKLSKRKIFKSLLLIITVLSLLFLILSILISDLLSIFLNINNISLIFISMGLTVIIEPFIKILSEYLENIKNNPNYQELIHIYQLIEYILLLIIALFTFRIFKLKPNIAISLLYLSKILSMLIIIIPIYLLKKENKNTSEDNINYQKEIKKILTNNSYKSTINIVKNSYYYISIIILYLVLSTRYNYEITELEKIIVFIYFYSLELINYIIYLVKLFFKELPKDMPIPDKIYNGFKTMLPLAIIFGIISPLTCKVLFNDSSKSIYLMMINFLAIFILMYEITYENIKNKSIINITLIIGLILKIILIIPLINSFYRMGYNLIYGDIISTIIAMFISIIINYIYKKNITKNKSKYFEKILDILYENIILSILLILTEFIVPINTSNYFKSLGLIIIYLIISISFIKIKNKKRG